MKTKTLLLLPLIVASTVKGQVYPDFTASPGAFGAPQPNFVADKILGSFAARTTFNPDGTFGIAYNWTGSLFAANDGANQLTGNQTGVPAEYQLYGLINISGTYFVDPAWFGGANFTIDPSTLVFDYYVDNNSNTTFTQPATGYGSWLPANAADDVLLFSSSGISGSGVVQSGSLGSFPGFFALNAELDLTPAGASFFVNPAPDFYPTFDFVGQFIVPGFTGTRDNTGSADMTFQPIPEPSSALMGGLGALLLFRRKRS